MALGYQNTAAGFGGTALGWGSSAGGTASAAIGYQNSASGFRSIAIGNVSAAEASGTIAIGEEAKATMDQATSIGYQTTASGNSSFALGSQSTASGFYSMTFGYLTNASGLVSMAMGSGTTASGDYSTAMGSGASTNGQTGSFVYGDNTGSVTLTSLAQNEFAVRASGGVRFRTRADLGTGCDLAAGGGVWNCTSSRAQKTDFGDVDSERLLSGLRTLTLQTWRYKGEPDSTRHLGPFAEEFRRAFGLGTDSLTIGHVDVGGVSLAAAKALDAHTRALQAALDATSASAEARTRELLGMIEARDGEIAALRSALVELTRRLDALDHRRAP